MSLQTVTVHRLGRVEYADGLALQKQFGEARASGSFGDVLLLLEHFPVLTLGRGASAENVVASPAALADLGVEIFQTNRGGDVTYHGPGQLVGYPILKLPPERHDVRRYVRDLEETLIRCLATFGIRAGRVAGWTGVWVRTGPSDAPEKIAAIGVHFSRWQTSHGFALNVSTDLSHFGWIVPCGIKEAGVTSMEKVLGHAVPLEDVRERYAEAFAEVFGVSLALAPAPLRTVSVAVLREDVSGPRVLLLRRTPERGGFFQLVTGRVERDETPDDAAVRELAEETGVVREVVPLDYRHAFALGDASPPQVSEETAYFARWPVEQTVTLDPAEHDLAEWMEIGEALSRLPHRGLRVAVERAVRRLSNRD